MDAYQLLELLQAHIEECEDNGIEAELVVITQPGYPLKGRILGVKSDGPKFTIGIEDGTQGYPNSDELTDLDGF